MMRIFRHVSLFRSLCITLWLGILSVSANVALAQAPAPDKSEPVVIGIIQSSQEDLVYIQETLNYLHRALPDVPFETTYLSENDAHLSILLKKVDFFVVSSGFYTMMSEKTGALALATLKPPQAEDPRFGSCALVITKAKNTQYETFQDIRSTRVVSASPRSFDGRTMVLGEVENLTRYPLNYFGKATFTSGSHLNVIERLRNDNADVGVLPACQYEKYVADGTISTNEFIPVNLQTNDNFNCMCSTRLYPHLVFAAHGKTDIDLTKRLSVALLWNVPNIRGYEWFANSDFRQVRQVVEKYEYSPYASEIVRSSQAISRYKSALFICFIMIAATVIYSVVVRKVVHIRTKDLQETITEKNNLEEESKQNRSRLAQLERSGVVSEFSSIIAHEIHQPISALINYADGLAMYLQDNNDPIVNEATKAISEQSMKISEIVERVRRYAKTKAFIHTTIDLVDVAEKAVTTFKASYSIDGVQILVSLPKKALVKGEPFELELLIVNLMRNALHAAKKTEEERPVIDLKIDAFEGGWRLSVKDNGPLISEEAFAHLSQPVSSNKIEGLGLGLSICRVIAERHVSELKFIQHTPYGIEVSLSFKEAPPDLYG